jgi:polysaccharide deacetylase 2 family uncharacterized protein YibQ
MKALGVATMLVLALISGILVWALVNEAPMSGEPTAFLQIKGHKKSMKTTQSASLGQQVKRRFDGGRAQVVLDVKPRSQSGLRVAGSSRRPGNNGLVEPGKFGPLPIRAKDGRSPSRVYARLVPPGAVDAKPRIAVLVTGLGLNWRLSQRAIKRLPADISLAFSVYGRRLPKLVGEAQRQGHELMLQVPLEPLDYPESDTGPKTLLVKQSIQEKFSRLYWSLGRFMGYFGVVNAKGGRYLANKKATAFFFKELQRRGLWFFRDNAGGSTSLSNLAENIGLGYSQATLQIDSWPSPERIGRALQKLEAVARRTGIAVGVAHMHPVSIDMVAKWAKGLESRGIRLVPISAAYRQKRG